MNVNKILTTAAAVLASAAAFSQQPSKLAADYPLLANRMTIDQPKIDATKTHVPRGTMIAAAPAKVKHRESELWGSIIYRSDWDTSQLPLGLYSFVPSNPGNITPMIKSVGIYSTGGGVYRNNTYYSVYLDMSMYEEMHTIGAYLSKYTRHDYGWTVDTLYQPLMGRFDLVATETAYLRSEDKVYGEFYTSDLKSYELGVVDYDKLTRTTIGSLSHAYVAMGITSDGKLYGVASDANLYQIDTSTAKETLIGKTGVYLTSNGSSSYYAQSGEIDQKDNTFYWCALDRRHNSSLYTVDLTTGKATKLHSLATADQVLNLQIPEPEAADGAPGPVSDLNVSLSGVSQNATITFTSPDTTYAGDLLEGQLTYEISCNGKTIDSGTIGINEDGESHVTLPTQSDTIVVRVSNSEGASPAVRNIVWVGYDIPQAPSGIDFTATKSGATISWKAPANGTHDGTIGNDVKYNVYRNPGHTTVAQGLSATNCADTYADDSHKAYYYTVAATAEGFTGPEGRSNSNSFTDAVQVPYNEEFVNSAQADNFTVYDSNNDRKSWYYDKNSTSMKYDANANNHADDWLITPAIHLEQGTSYDFGLKYYEQYMMCEEQFMIAIGKKASPEAMTRQLSDTMTTMTFNDEYFRTKLTVDETGDYFIGFHALSSGQQGILTIDSIGIAASVSAKAPGKGVIGSVDYGNSRNREATVNFTAPSVCADGTALTSLNGVNIYRNGIFLATVNDAKPGESQSYTDTAVPADGYNYYNIAAVNASGVGAMSDKGYAYIGNDTPKEPVNVKAIDRQTAVELHWTMPKRGTHEGFVDAAKTWYKIYERGTRTLTLIDSIQGDTTINIPVNTDEGEQRVLRYGVLAQTDGGVSNISDYATLIAGKAVATPFHESFKDGNTSNFIWVPATVNKNWTRTAVYSSDLENGTAYVAPSQYGLGEEQRISTGRIDLSQTPAPQLMFSYLSIPGANGTLTASAVTPDGTRHTLSFIDFTKLEGHGWHSAIADLSAYKGERYVLIDFSAKFTDMDGFVYLDNINVGDLAKNDLAMQLQAPNTIAKGRLAKLLVNVANLGTDDAQSFTVTLRSGSKQIAKDTVNTVLAAGAKRQLCYEFTPSVLTDDATATINASITYAGDANFANNIDGKVVALIANDSNSPQNLQSSSAGGAVTLSWAAPEIDTIRVTDDFEHYDDWLTENIGDWTTVCADGGANRAFFDGYPCPNDGQKFAYELFNVNTYEPGYDITDHNSSLIPHSGEKYLCSNLITDGKGNKMSHDDWLISPELSGGEQTVSLWVNNFVGDVIAIGWPITIAAYESFGGKDTADFKMIDKPVTINVGNWQLINITLLEGTKYFALRNITPDSVSNLMLVDDVSYIPASKRLEGYNVYADGNLVGTTTATEYTIYSAAEGNHDYSVTAVYGRGSESAPAMISQTTGIRDTTVDSNSATTVYSLSGMRLNTPVGKLPKGVYIINGRKVVVGR